MGILSTFLQKVADLQVNEGAQEDAQDEHLDALEEDSGSVLGITDTHTHTIPCREGIAKTKLEDDKGAQDAHLDEHFEHLYLPANQQLFEGRCSRCSSFCL
jgi:hypothetical protein